ncbi:MAG TPA: NAD(P)H-dependent glycerol-3-phosphate dehydrogenase [Alphaproteobacteria bacterium]|nr:NAD(P)H-dependent glycerol-3-phosphate dehydrogenase [Alphaproteobacteria bacterium]
MKKIAIAGAGAWGLALAGAVQRAGAQPLVWSRRAEAAALTTSGVTVTGDDARVAGHDVLLLAVPAQEIEAVSSRLARQIAPTLPLVICAKGVARRGHLLLTDVLETTLPGRPLAVLSGPTFAEEVARGLPTAVTIASRDPAVADKLAKAIGSATFRPYISTDPVGVQLGGAVKNVIAIACGIVTGRRLGENARAALMTRGLAEMVRLGRALGADPETFLGLAGLGDLSLTATSLTSRNFRFGTLLGEGLAADEARAAIAGVVEGAATAEAVVELAAAHNIEMPISAAVAAIVERGAGIAETMTELLSRPFKPETA